MKQFFMLLLLIFSFRIYSQDSNIQFSNLSNADGLSQNSVYAILQDNEGFMWFGTSEGLNKYDGNEFVHYRYELADSNSLSDNLITSIIETSDKKIWIATYDGGINIFDKQSEKFTHLKHNPNNTNSLTCNTINIIFEDRDKNIWIGSKNGLSKYITEKNQFKQYSHNQNDTNCINAYSILSIYVDYNNNKWIGTENNGLKKINNQTGEIVEFTTEQNTVKDTNFKTVRSIFNDKKNKDIIWLVAENGLYKLDILTEKIEKINCSLNKKIRFSKGIIDSSGIIWIGTQVNGLFKYCPDDMSFTNFNYDPNNKNSISNSQILSFYIDNSGLLWIGTKGGGVNKLLYDNFYHLSLDPVKINSLSNNNVWAIYKDSSGILWIGTENGLNKIDKTNNVFTLYQSDPNNPNSLSNDFIFAIYEDQFNNLWIGTNGGGLNLLNRKTGEFKHFINQPGDLKSLSNNNVKTIFQDSFGDLWIGTRGGGLNKFNYKDQTFTQFKNDPKNSKSIGINSINTICETSDSILWIGTAGAGLDRYDRSENTFTHYNINLQDSNSINDIQVLSLIEGPDKNLWIGTFNGGVNRFDYHKNKFTHFTIENGLANNIIYSIELDNNGNFWLSSNGFLSKFDTKSFSVINFNIENGVENLEFNQNASFKSKNGYLFFGGINGLNYFNPENFTPELTQPSLHFTKLLLNNIKIQHGNNQPIKKPITFESQIKLNYNEYPFSIYFSALNLKYPKSNQYHYRIKKLKNKWIDIGNENKITFTKLPPGKYTLEVKATNSFNLWSVTKFIDIIIVPPFWKKLWFLSLVTILLIILIGLGIIYREKKIRKNNRILEIKIHERTKEIALKQKELKTQMEYNLLQQEKIKKQNTELELHKNHLEELVQKRTIDLVNAKNRAEESDRLKSSFLANISHEIRTPMNAIVGFSELLRETGNPTEEQLEMLNLINFNSNSLLNIINDIVDIAKLEIGEISIKKTDTDINKLLSDLLKTYNNSEELQQKALELRLVHFNEPIILLTDKVRLKQILSKLLDNAIKYTENGFIELGYQIEKENQAIKFYVKDTGIGLSESQQDEIFKLFRKIESDKKRVYRGVGLGLTFCHKLVHLLDGEIWVESKEYTGSTFYFKLPITTSLQSHLIQRKITPEYNWKNKNILIAEDEINNFKLLEATLKNSHATIYHAQNGLEAVDIATNNNIDLIIMDIKMPEMDGLEAVKIIRKTNKDVKIIAFTAYAMSNDEVHAINYGCDDYISKPAKPQFIMKKISEYLN